MLYGAHSQGRSWTAPWIALAWSVPASKIALRGEAPSQAAGNMGVVKREFLLSRNGELFQWWWWLGGGGGAEVFSTRP